MSIRQDVTVIDGQPQAVMNAAGVAQAVRTSPLGPDEALRRLSLALTPEHFASIKKEYDRD